MVARITKKRLTKIIVIIPIVLVCVITVAWIVAFIHFRSSNIERQFDSVVKKENIHEAILFVENSTGDFSVSFGYGGRDIDSPMITASVTKMFTTACILILYDDGRLSLDDKISLHIDDEVLSGLHIYRGHEYSFELTISNLLFQTSGLPDYFTNNIARDIIVNGDRYVAFEEILEKTRTLTPSFAPNSDRAYYADINFDLLGLILENITGLPLEKIYEQFIFNPLEMANTYLPVKVNDFVPHTFYGSERIERPLFIASTRASGGVISTARDMMIFSRAFWNGDLFDNDILERISDYRRLQLSMSPIQYGGGHMRILLSGPSTFFLASGNLIGHSGSTGSFVFFFPEKDLHFIGDLAQLESPGSAVRFVMQMAMAIDGRLH